MDKNPSKGPSPPGYSKMGGSQKQDHMDVDSDGNNQASQSRMSLAAAGSMPGQRTSASGAWPQQTAPQGDRKMGANQNAGAGKKTGLNVPLQGGPKPFGGPAPGKFSSQQQTPMRGQMMVGGQPQGMYGSKATNKGKVPGIQQGSSFDRGANSYSPASGAGLNGGNSSLKSSPPSASHGTARDQQKNIHGKPGESGQPLGPTGHRGPGGYAGGISQAGPQSNVSSQNAPRRTFMNESQMQSGPRQVPLSSSLSNGPGMAGNGRENYSQGMNGPSGLNSGPHKFGKPGEHNYGANPNRQGEGPPPRVPPNTPASAAGTPMQMGHMSSNMNPKMSAGPSPSGPGEKGKLFDQKRPAPNGPPNAQLTGGGRPGMHGAALGAFNHGGGMGKPKQNQTMQVGRRPLPMAGGQPTAMPQGGGGPSPHPNSPPPGPMHISNPTGAMGFQNRMEEQQPQRHGAPPPHPSMPAGAGPPPMRELRVEDALLYLDDVKREFKDRPAIYNEFLAIMKNFKSQEVDTPGVIARVSKLFRGYNNLILGFNTFLPDGYKISSADLKRQEAELQMQEEAERKKRATPPGGPRGPPPKGRKPGSVPPQQMQSPPAPPAIQPVASHMQQPPVPPRQPPPQGPPRQQPPPPGLRGQEGPPRQSPQPPQMHPPQRPPPRASPPSTQHVLPPKQSNGPSPVRPPSQGPPPAPTSAPPVGPPSATPPNQPGRALPQHQAVEFDHAISYVTTIKKRFANDPGTYHAFLEILHTYQKEQRGIKEVLEQVAHLFQDHPDLLKEFTFFLPDAVQEQAKERLHRAAAESESRIAAQRQQQMMEQFNQRAGAQPAQGQQSLIDMTRRGQPPDAEVRGRKRPIDSQPVPIMAQPEAFVYNSAVERQFFDSAREALSSFSRDGGQAWAEFLKCLDMYAQEILSRSEMLNFVEPLLGKRNNNLFEEFKRILSAAGAASGAASLMEDSWYSVPLAEIDFSRCRRCTPSYRALPRDYPAHPCSERSELEAKVLNDIWVSLPVGSEESYTFRHMRRNTFEETLFRVEDERFEIDMVIDSNATTLHRLEPIAEEIAQLARVDVKPTDLGLKTVEEGTGLAGKRFQYSFDKSILGVIQRNTIARIYGDAGKEMLTLLEKNPTVAIPLVVSRLRQKQSEWLKVRTRLNRHWKELAEHNYYKSLDHRSLTWRTIDKRAISTRTLLGEIKDRAMNGGREGKEAYRQKLDKAKEEHGTFYEVTVGSKLDHNLDLTFLPKPDRRLFTPHHSILYDNVSWAQRDAYRILAFALERGPISPADKERCHRLWIEFLGPWLGLSLNWMQKPAATYQETTSSTEKSIPALEATVVSEDDEEESLDEDPHIERDHVVTEEIRRTLTKPKEYTDHHPLPAGAHVSTLYGEGKILEFRRSDHIYKVKLGFGAIGYLRPATVLCSMLPVENSAYTRQLRADDRTKLARTNDQLIFGTQSLYLFFRLHHILVCRLNTAKRLAYTISDDASLETLIEQIPNSNPKTVGKLRYEAYVALLYALLDGGIGGASEGGKYEDRVRTLLGHGAYELATMDKLISHIWKDVQTMANDETMWNLVQLYRRHYLSGSFQPEAFRQEAAYLSDGEPMYAFQHCPMPDSDQSVLHMEYVGIMDDEDEDAMEEEEVETTEQSSNKRQKR